MSYTRQDAESIGELPRDPQEPWRSQRHVWHGNQEDPQRQDVQTNSPGNWARKLSEKTLTRRAAREYKLPTNWTE